MRLCVCLALLTAFLTQPALAGPSRLDERNAATELMDKILFVLGAAVYCDKSVQKNPKLMEAAGEWNARNKPFMERVVALVKATGDMSKAEKDEMDKGGYKKVKAAMASRAACDDHLKGFTQGQFDLNRNPETRGQYAIVQTASLAAGDKIWIVLHMTNADGKPMEMTFHNPSSPIPDMNECRKALPSLESTLIKSARDKEPMMQTAKFVKVECIASSYDPIRPS